MLYKHKSWCTFCGERKPKGLFCADCGLKMRNNKRKKTPYRMIKLID